MVGFVSTGDKDELSPHVLERFVCVEADSFSSVVVKVTSFDGVDIQDAGKEVAEGFLEVNEFQGVVGGGKKGNLGVGVVEDLLQFRDLVDIFHNGCELGRRSEGIVNSSTLCCYCEKSNERQDTHHLGE